MIELGRLEKIANLREVWIDEARDFTPWLAQEENLAILGDTIGIDLELEAQEQYVGPFKADILCKDTLTDKWVLIENQIEKTDHSHLGQILTYGAGLEATTIVWIAKRFSDEHRAALDWLNEITNENFNFFGLEIELWRIGNSPIAPKFNVVSKPNEWTVGRHPHPPVTITPYKQLLLDYWNGFIEVLREHSDSIKIHEPRPVSWMSFPIGRTDAFLATLAFRKDKKIGVQLYLKGSNGLAKIHFDILHKEKESIEKSIGLELEWNDSRKKERSIDLFKYDVDLENHDNWPEQHQWLYEKLETFYKAFTERVKKLPIDYPPEDDMNAINENIEPKS